MTDYLRLAQERADAAQVPRDPVDEQNPYLKLAQGLAGQQEDRARFVIDQALKYNPDTAAEIQRLRTSTGLPMDVVERNLEEVRRREAAAAIDYIKIVQDSPILARQLTDPNFTTVAIDDIGVLSDLGRILRDTGVSALKGAVGLPQAAVGIADIPSMGQVGKALESVGYRPNEAQDILSGFYSESTQRALARVQNADGFLASLSTALRNPVSIYTTVLESLPQVIGGAALARGLLAVGGNFGPVVAGSVGEGLMAAGAAAEGMRGESEDGLLTAREALSSLGLGAGTSLLGYAGGRIAKGLGLGDVDTALAQGDLTGTPAPGFAKQVLGQGISEGLFEELPQSVQEQMWQNFAAEKPLFDGVGNAAAMGLLAGGVTGAGFGAIQATAAKVVGAAAQQADAIERATLDSERLSNALDAATQSALRERSPEQFRQLLAQMAPDEQVYVDGEVLAQLPTEVLNQLPATVVEQVAQAAAIGDVVGIPVADALTVAPGTELEQALVDHGRKTPDAMSAVEARQAGEQAEEFLKQEAERVIAQAQDQEALRASAEVVRTSIVDQLNAAGRYRPQINEAMSQWASAFYTAYGSRLGMTPEEFYQRYPLRVLGAPVGQQTGVLNAEGGMTLADVTAQWDAAGIRNAAFEKNGVITLSQIIVPQDQRERGVGTSAMQALVEYADRTGQRIALSPSADFGGNKKRLMEFYKRFGFVENKGRNKDFAVSETMIREPQQVLEQRGVQAKGKAIPDSIDAVSNVESSFQFAGSQQFPNNRDFKLAIQGRVLEAAKAAKVTLDEFTQGVEQYLVRIAVADGQTALRTNANAVGWYNEKVTKALRLVSLIHPEIATDPQAKFAFVWAMAVTSNGLKVDKNFELAEKVYQGYKATGQMPTDIGIGTAAEAINRSLGLYNTLIAKHGFETVERFMTTLQPAGEVEKFTGQKVSGENKTTMVYGAAALGPKIGNGFFMNLYGRFEQLTMDRWLMRTWGRWTATLVESNPAQVKAKRTALKALIQSLTPADKKAFEAIIKRKLTVGDIDAVGQAIWKASQKPANRAAMSRLGVVDEAGQVKLTEILGETKKGQVRVSIGDELRKGGNALTKYLDGQKEAPAGPPERGNIRKVFQQALAELQQQHPALTMSDFQALLWYPEKRLYDAAKTADEAADAYEDDEAPDYANAAAKLARAQGVPDADISATVAAVDAELQAAVGAAGVRPGDRGPGDRAGDTGQVLNQEGLTDGRDQPAGDRAGRYASGSLAPLEGAPNVAGASGPDPRLVAVAEQYARDNGIPLRRQGEYAQVDPERAARIAAAYDAMVHAPQDPAVREAYENLIQQTLAQYRALEAAGYRFYLIDESNDPYGGNPWNAMRDLRANQTMGVFATEAGFGSGATELNVEDNPLLADTGLRWPYGSPDGEPKRVLANDLFRAVHDAFGHGLEGAGFRAQGEENAWQAHIRLFTGSARGAITSETRGQNSWLNFGPYGESNRNAKVENTVFADQKTGLMPEWTWSEGIVEDMPDEPLAQGPRGTFNPRTLELVLSPTADLSTFFHETGHFFLEVMADVASQPDAPAMIQEDMAKILAWFGVPDLATWNSMTLDQQRPYHERWAESIEQYVMEGKVPSAELQPLMRRFRAWLISVYQSIKQFVAGKPELQLNDDIRRVMDRMVATDEQIAQANEVAGFMPDEQADGEAAERLQKRSMADLKWAVKARDKAIARIRREAREIEKKIRAEVIVEIDATREMQARAALSQLRKDKNYNDQTRATVADSFGYASVAQMDEAIAAFGKRSDAIDGRTEQRMLEEYGDLVDDRAIQQAANEAVHNEARARSLATELRTQQEMVGQRTDTGRTNVRGARITVNTLVEAAKQFGANVVSRTVLKDLRIAAQRHVVAERKAGRRWQEATTKGDTQAAVQAKRDQVLNNAAAKALLEAQDEVKKIQAFFGRVMRDGNEKTVDKGRDPDIVNAARAVLAEYGYQTRNVKKAGEYLEVVKREDPETWAAIEPIVALATQAAQPLDSLSFEQLVGLHESIQSLWFLSKRSRQMEIDGDLMDIEDLADQLYARMDEIGIPDRIPGEGMAVSKAEERGLFLKQGIAFLRRVEQWAEGMDGGYGGPFLRYVFQPIKNAADRYRAARLDYRKKFQALVDNLAPIVGDSVIDAPELRYRFGAPGSTAGTAMNEILHAIAHTGNDSNKRKLLLGRGWAKENPDGTLDTSRWDMFIQRLVDEGKLTKEHFDFVQGVWDLLEETKPLAQQAHRVAFGRFFDEITANAFVDPFGVERRGGYIPAQVDTRVVTDNSTRRLLEEQNQSMAYAFPQPDRGFTRGRVDYNRELLLDLRSLSQHIDKVLLFSYMTVPARNVRKLLTQRKVSQPLNRIQPAAYDSMLTPWLQRSSQQIVETPVIGSGRWARLPGILRARAGMALMFANVSNSIQQITGLSTAAVRVKPSYLMRSMAQYVANPRQFSRAVWDASPYMDDRAKNEIAVLNEQMQAILIKPTEFERMQDWAMRHAYFLQTALDNVLSPIVWTGAFNQALEQGMSDKDAVRFADSTVRQTQGSVLPEDVSRIETGPAYARIFTQFVSYFNMMANTNGTALKQITNELGLRKGAGKALYVVAMGLMVPIWVAEAIAIAFRGGPDDEDDDGYLDDWVAQVFGMGTVKGALAQVPILGQFGVAGINRFNDNPLDDRVSLSPAISFLESFVGTPQSVYDAIVEDGSAQKAIRDVATLVSVATGVPIYAVARPLGYAAGVAEGRIEPTGPVDVARGLITGTASPESKAQ